MCIRDSDFSVAVVFFSRKKYSNKIHTTLINNSNNNNVNNTIITIVAKTLCITEHNRCQLLFRRVKKNFFAICFIYFEVIAITIKKSSSGFARPPYVREDVWFISFSFL